MKVSDEQLDYFISEITDDAMMGTSNAKEVMHLLLELKAIRQAATAGVEEAATSLMEVFSNARVRYEIGDKPAEVWLELRTAIASELTAHLAERDAVLRECREYVQDAVDEQSRGRELLAKIDKLTKGGGDGSN